MIIDTHCHFDMMPSPDIYIKRIENEGNIVIGMTNLPSHFQMGYSFVSSFNHVRLALGLHPLLAAKHKSEFSLFNSLLDKTSYVGEVGLDFSREGLGTKNLQIESFDFVLNAVKGKKKILSIHSRRAEETVIQMLVNNNIQHAIFHWYSGNLTTLRKVIANGYYLSVNEAMTTSANGKKIIASIPLDRLLTETDAPFNINNNIYHVIEYIGSLYHMSKEDVEDRIKKNFFKMIENILV